MNRRSFFGDPLVKSAKTGTAVTERQINLAVPDEFAGKEDFVRFYMRHNGGAFTGFAYFYRDKFRRVSDRDVNLMCVFDFLRISKKSSSSAEHGLSIDSLRAAILKGCSNEKQKKFTESHIPFAGDGSGDYYWIETPSGRIRFVDHESVGDSAPRPIEVAPSFIDFVSNLKAEAREEDRFGL